MRKIGLILPLRNTWRGGLNYYHNLLDCYRQYPDESLRIEVFTDDPEEIQRYQGDSIQVHACPEAKSLSLRRPADLPRRFLNGALGYDPILLNIMKRHNIDLLTHYSLGNQGDINTLFWMPDMQHKVYPGLFKARERANRDREIQNTRRWGQVLLSSQTAANHFRHYYPELSSVRTHVLRFSSAAVLNTTPMTREELDELYPTRDPYLFLPNQFWKHKNHAVVVNALRQVPDKIRVICSGPMVDPRNPSYVPGLLAKAKELGLEDRFICLGTVPYAALVSLMHHSVAVLQPSLFEGWSTSVEESKSMRKRIILSNIDVHVEQAPERGLFFSPNSPEELSTYMVKSYAEYSPEIEATFAAQRMQFKTQLQSEWIRHFASILHSVQAGR